MTLGARPRPKRLLGALGAGALLSGALWLAAGAPPSAAELRPVPLERWCPTLGRLEPSAGTALVVSEPKLRGTVAGSDGNAVALDFELVGPSERTEPLRSGELRQQLGLELVAQDTCNLLYVMWRVAPRPELVVSVKQNPGQSTHARCENRGYRRLPSEQLAPVPALGGGARHTLAARIDAGRLEVTIDGERVLSAALDGAARELHGRVGLRSDNLRFVVHQLRAAFAEGGPTCDG